MMKTEAPREPHRHTFTHISIRNHSDLLIGVIWTIHTQKIERFIKCPVILTNLANSTSIPVYTRAAVTVDKVLACSVVTTWRTLTLVNI